MNDPHTSLPLLIGITGAAGAGKNTVAQHLDDWFGYVQWSFAEPIKRGLSDMFGWPHYLWADRAWKEEVIPHLGKSPRQLAQTLGTEWGRDCIDTDVWVNQCFHDQDKFNRNMGDKTTHVITDVRFPNEVSAIRKRGGLIIEVFRPDVKSISSHSSEEQQLSADIRLLNDGSIEELGKAIDMLICKF